MAAKPHSEDQIFDEALKRPAGGERLAYLDAVCGHDGGLRARVVQLLKAYAEAGSFLDSPAAVIATANMPSITERPGTVIGPYKLVEQIGEGGFGVVYLAEQQQPVRRKVALKIIKPGMDTREVIARFGAERQALALMDHPHIARVFDAGTTESGRPYFVMELVRGVPITEYCDQCSLTTRERLELFISVCQAVQHAHQKGIIHRDIKPSNVMIAIQDGRPTAKVIDFGVAKAINQRLTEATVYTQFAQMIGTPLYMSPEQAEMSALDIDTRGDIYSLGVLLYELLTGTTPFARERLKEATFDELRRIIREEEPPKPSHRLSTLGDLADTIAEHRHTDARRLNQLVRGDLDWIVMKCLEKDRTRRYETASALARDIERYLHDEPVEACPPSAAYRIRKFSRRNKGALIAAAFVAISLVTGIAVATWQANVAHQETKRANAEAKTSKQVKNILERLFVDPEGVAWMGYQLGAVQQAGTTLTAREILDRGKKAIEELDDQPDVQTTLMDTIGYIYRSLGYLEEAEPLLTEALARRRRSLEPMHLDLASSLEHVAGLRFDQGRLDESALRHREAAAMRRKLLGNEHPLVAESLFQLGFIETQNIRYPEAEEYFRESLKIREQVLEPGHRDIGFSLWGVAWILARDAELRGPEDFKTELAEILALNDRARKIFAAIDQGKNVGMVACLYLDAVINASLGNKKQSIERFQETVALARRFLGEEHPLVAVLMKRQAGDLRSFGEIQQAVEIYRKTLAIRQKIYGEEHGLTAESMLDLAIALNNSNPSPAALEEIKQFSAQALPIYAEYRVHERHLRTEDSEADRLRRIARDYRVIASLANQAGQPDFALKYQLRALELEQKLADEYPDQTRNATDRLSGFHALRKVAFARKRAGDLAGAVEMMRQADAFIDAQLAEDPGSAKYRKWKNDHVGQLLRFLRAYGSQLKQQQRQADAERLEGETAALLDKLAAEAPDDPEILSVLAAHAVQAGRHSEAAKFYRKALEAYRRAGDDTAATRAYLELGLVSKATGEDQEAADAWRTALELNPDPAIDYRVRISTPGEHRLFLRSSGHDGESDSCYARIVELADGPGGAADWYQFVVGQAADFEERSWQGDALYERARESLWWLTEPAVWTIPVPGDYTIRLFPRDKRTGVDALLLQRADLPMPYNDGPPESKRTDDGVFLESDGRVVAEAEHFTARSAADGKWFVVPSEDPDHDGHRNYRGTGYVQVPTGQRDGTFRLRKSLAADVTCLKASVIRRPEQAAVRYQLGIHLVRAGDMHAAIDAFKKSSELAQWVRGHSAFQTAMAYMQLGNEEQARKWHQIGVQWIYRKDFEAFKDEASPRLGAESARLLGLSDDAAGDQEVPLDDIQYCSLIIETDSELAWPYIQRARKYRHRGQYEQAEADLRQALAIQCQTFGKERDLVASTLANLAGTLSAHGEFTEAEELYREALAIYRKLHGDVHDTVGTILHELGMCLTRQGRHADAENHFRQAVAAYAKQVELSPDNEGYRHRLRRAHNLLAENLSKQGRDEDAEKIHREALAFARQIDRNRHRNVADWHRHIADRLYDLGWFLSQRGRRAEAEVQFREAVDIGRNFLEKGHPAVGYYLNAVAWQRFHQGDPKEAETYFRQGLNLFRKAYGEEHADVGDCLRALALVRGHQGDMREKEKLARQALAVYRKVHGDEHPTVADMLHHLGISLAAQGKRAEAETVLRERLEALRKSHGADHPAVADTLHHVGNLLAAQDKHAEAEKLYSERLDALRQLHGERHHSVAHCLQNLAKCLAAQGDEDRASALFDEALAIWKHLVQSVAYSPRGEYITVNIQPYANQPLTDSRGLAARVKHNDLAEVPRGEQFLRGVKFQVGERFIQLAGQNLPDRPKSVAGIAVNRHVGKLHFLHNVQWGGRGQEFGHYRVRFADGGQETVPIIGGKDVRDWWYLPGHDPTEVNIAWVGASGISRREFRFIHLSLTTWENPHPEREVTSIDYVSANTKAAPFCVAITVEQPVENGISNSELQ